MEHTNMRKKSRFRSRRETGPFGYQKQKTAKEAPRTNSTELAQAFREATELHAAGRLVEAEKMYRQILNAQPTHCDSRHSLGVIYYQRGDHQEAVRQSRFSSCSATPAIGEPWSDICWAGARNLARGSPGPLNVGA